MREIVIFCRCKGNFSSYTSILKQIFTKGRVNLLRCIHPKVLLVTFIVVLNGFST